MKGITLWSIHIPHSLKDKLNHTIEKHVQSGVLVKVNEPTDWVHNMVIVENTKWILAALSKSERSQPGCHARAL